MEELLASMRAKSPNSQGLFGNVSFQSPDIRLGLDVANSVL